MCYLFVIVINSSIFSPICYSIEDNYNKVYVTINKEREELPNWWATEIPRVVKGWEKEIKNFDFNLPSYTAEGKGS